jgi:hypothetical protein
MDHHLGSENKILKKFNLTVFWFWTYFFGGLKCVAHSFAYVAHFVFFRDIRARIYKPCKEHRSLAGRYDNPI